jgi:Ca-activated chloride channel homolog
LLLVEFFISEKRKGSKKILASLLLLFAMNQSLFAQNARSAIIKGNEAYKKNDFSSAEKSYREALKADDTNTTAHYNLGNALYRNDNADEAIQSYDNTIQNSQDNLTKEKAYYNKGVAYQKAKKLPECINAYKNALVLGPQDEEARQNLQRALIDQKQKQQQQNQKDQKQQNKNEQQKKDEQKKNPQNQNNSPKPQPSKISRQDAEEKLKSLLENEKELQDKLHKIKGAASPDKPEKDW